MGFCLQVRVNRFHSNSAAHSSLACNLLGACVVYFFLYESSHLTLESVDDVSGLICDVNRSTHRRRTDV